MVKKKGHVSKGGGGRGSEEVSVACEGGKGWRVSMKTLRVCMSIEGVAGPIACADAD